MGVRTPGLRGYDTPPMHLSTLRRVPRQAVPCLHAAVDSQRLLSTASALLRNQSGSYLSSMHIALRRSITFTPSTALVQRVDYIPVIEEHQDYCEAVRWRLSRLLTSLGVAGQPPGQLDRVRGLRAQDYVAALIGRAPNAEISLSAGVKIASEWNVSKEA